MYIHQPSSFRNPKYPDYVCLLYKSMYDLKQALHAEYHNFIDFDSTLGPSHSVSDHFLFICNHGNDTTLFLFYVDDIILTISLDTLH